MAIALAITFIRGVIKEWGDISPQSLTRQLESAPQAVRTAVGQSPAEVSSFVACFPHKFTILGNGNIEVRKEDPETGLLKCIIDKLKNQGEMKLGELMNCIGTFSQEAKSTIGQNLKSLKAFLEKWPFIFYVKAHDVGLLVHGFTKLYSTASCDSTTDSEIDYKGSSILLQILKIFIEIGLDTKLTCMQLYAELQFHLGKDLSSLGLSSHFDLVGVLLTACGTAVLRKVEGRYSFNYKVMTKEVMVQLLVSALLECKNYTSLKYVKELLSMLGLAEVENAAVDWNRFHEISHVQGFVGLSEKQTWLACTYLLNLLKEYDNVIKIKTITGCLSNASEAIRATLGRNYNGIKDFALRNNRIFTVVAKDYLASYPCMESGAVQFFVDKLKDKESIKVKNLHSFFSNAPLIVKHLAEKVGVDGVIDILKASTRISFEQNSSVMCLRDWHGVQPTFDDMFPNFQDDSSCTGGSSYDFSASESSESDIHWTRCTGDIFCIFDSWGLIDCNNPSFPGQKLFFNSEAFFRHTASLRKFLAVGQVIEYFVGFEETGGEMQTVISNVRYKPVFTDDRFRKFISPDHGFSSTEELDHVAECSVNGKDVIHSHIEMLKNLSWLLIGKETNISHLFASTQITILKNTISPLETEVDLHDFIQLYNELFEVKDKKVKLKQCLYEDQVTNMLYKNAGFVGKNGFKQSAFFRASDLHSGDSHDAVSKIEVKVGTPVRVISIPVTSFPKLYDGKMSSKRRAIIVLPMKRASKNASPQGSLKEGKTSSTDLSSLETLSSHGNDSRKDKKNPTIQPDSGSIRSSPTTAGMEKLRLIDVSPTGSTSSTDSGAGKEQCKTSNETNGNDPLPFHDVGGVQKLHHLMTSVHGWLRLPLEKQQQYESTIFSREPQYSSDTFKQVQDRIIRLRNSDNSAGNLSKSLEPTMVDCIITQTMAHDIYAKSSIGEIVQMDRNSIFSLHSLITPTSEGDQNKTKACTCICLPCQSSENGKKVKWKSVMAWPQELNKHLLQFNMQLAYEKGTCDTETVESKVSSAQSFKSTNDVAKKLADIAIGDEALTDSASIKIDSSDLSDSGLEVNGHVDPAAPAICPSAGQISPVIAPSKPTQTTTLLRRGSNSDHLRILMECCLLLAGHQELSFNDMYRHLELTNKCHHVIESVEDLKAFIEWYGIFAMSDNSLCLMQKPVPGKVTKTGYSLSVGQYGFLNSPQDPGGVFFTAKEVFMPKLPEKKCFVDYTVRVQHQVEYIAIPVTKLPQQVVGLQVCARRAVLLWTIHGHNRPFGELVATFRKDKNTLHSLMDGIDSLHCEIAKAKVTELDRSSFYDDEFSFGGRSCNRGSQTLSTGGIIMKKYVKLQ